MSSNPSDCDSTCPSAQAASPGASPRSSVSSRKRAKRDSFISAFEARPDGEQSLWAFWNAYPCEMRPSYETARYHISKRQRVANYQLPERTGRPNTLSKNEEEEIAERCNELIRRHGFGFLTNSVIQVEALDVASRPRSGESPLSQSILERCKRVGGYYWCRNFRKTYGFTKHQWRWWRHSRTRMWRGDIYSDCRVVSEPHVFDPVD